MKFILKNFAKMFMVALLMFVCGCASVVIESPSHMRVIMAPANSNPEKVYRQRVWFIFYGLIPLNDNSSAYMIEEHGLHYVKTRVYYRWDDILLSILTSPFTIYRETIEVRGAE